MLMVDVIARFEALRASKNLATAFARALAVALALLPSPLLASDCAPRDFLAMPLPDDSTHDAVALALELAYPDLVIEGRTLRFSDGMALPLDDDRGLSAQERLLDPTIVEQFTDPYPLDFDLSARIVPWFDPGRARNDAFFRSLYFQREADGRSSLTQVRYVSSTGAEANFTVTRRRCVAVQLEAAFRNIAAHGAAMDRYFDDIGGGYSWRAIAGTTRLSAHSFGIAVDFNTRLGGYWRWSGRPEGDVGAYANNYPQELVRAMERYGFIWGGKWHHFDGMHFEYRPELILHGRLIGLR